MEASGKHPLVDPQEIPLISDCLPTPRLEKKRNNKTENLIHSKRPMYCRNAYMHYIVKQLIKNNPYISLRSILTVLESKHIECKEVTVSRFRMEERAKFITPMKSIISSFQTIRTAFDPL